MKKTSPTSSESAQLQALLNNDRVGIEAIYRDTFPGIKAWIGRNNGNSQDAGDVLQDAIIVVFEKASRPDFELTGSFRSYLTSVCRFIWLRKLRKNKRSVPMSDENDLVSDETIETVLQEEEREALFQKYFRELNEVCRRVLTLFFEGQKMREIAEAMGYAEKFARVKKHLCRKKLMERIQRDCRYRELALGRG